MAVLRVGAMATVCESHYEYGKEWRGKRGHVVVITRKTISIQMRHCVIHVPRDKVVT